MESPAPSVPCIRSLYPDCAGGIGTGFSRASACNTRKSPRLRIGVVTDREFRGDLQVLSIVVWRGAGMEYRIRFKTGFDVLKAARGAYVGVKGEGCGRWGAKAPVIPSGAQTFVVIPSGAEESRKGFGWRNVIQIPAFAGIQCRPNSVFPAPLRHSRESGNPVPPAGGGLRTGAHFTGLRRKREWGEWGYL